MTENVNLEASEPEKKTRDVTDDENALLQQALAMSMDDPSSSVAVSALDARYRLSESKDYDVKVAFLQIAISSRCINYYNEAEKTLKEVGRMKYLRPLYGALVEGPGKEEEKIFAKRVFSEACASYHPIAQGVVEAILSKHT